VPRRAVNGIDLNRLHLLVAVLGKRARLDLGQQDVFVNAAGGVRITEPAADLAVALAIASNVRNRPSGSDLVALGELGLSGEVRRVGQLERRLLEAHRMGFKRAVIPAEAEISAGILRGMKLLRVATVLEAIGLCFNGS
jgi:DNA repair protein RadA/Sms